MRSLEKNIIKTPVLGHIILIAYRIKVGMKYFYKILLDLTRWLFKSKETTNFTYNLEDINKRYLAALIADVVNIEVSVIDSYIKEIEEDEALKRHILHATANSERAFMADKQVRFGKRVGWYAFARAMKPKLIVETGVDKGLGSCVLASALKKNKEEGFDGHYYGTDINPDAGYLLSGEYTDFGTILYGDSIESLKKINNRIDLFINDSDHSAEYEADEYVAISNNISENAILLGDNAHCTDKLFIYSLERNRRFAFFHEKPLNHWYPGGGIGISFKR